MRIDEITLVLYEYPVINNRTTEHELSRITCWSKKKSVKSSEFYAAAHNGINVEAIFEVSPIDFQGHQRLVHGGAEYDIIRSYKIGVDTIELTCQRRVGK